jgi:hypothetical protein
MLRTALHVTLTPIVFAFVGLMIATRLPQPGGSAVMVGAVALGVLYGWRNRHR